jgi:hypothetical protein
VAPTNQQSGNDVGILTFYPENAHRIPETAGVYSFFFNPFRQSSLGIFRDSVPSSATISAAKKALSRRLQRFDQLKESVHVNIRGSVVNAGKLAQVRFSGALSCDTATNKAYLDVPEDCFVEFLQLAEASVSMHQPVYCGMTTEQGLRTRYHQHLDDYSSGNQATFGGRLASFSINWSDLVFQCVPVRASASVSPTVRMSEQLIIDYSLPLLNSRL